MGYRDFSIGIPCKPLEALFEPMEGSITLSSVGLLLLEEVRKPTSLTPFVSKISMPELARLREFENVDPDAYLVRVGSNQAALEKAKHKTRDGFYWLKPGRTRDRYLVSIEAWRLLIWKAWWDHAPYEASLNDPDYPRKLQSERRTKYAPFYRLEIAE